MNFVALALLEACGGNDENAFWILAGMCENLELEVNVLLRLLCVCYCKRRPAHLVLCSRAQVASLGRAENCDS